MVNSLENIDKSKVSADRIEGLDAKIQEELSTAVTGAASTIITSDLTANRAVISNANGKVAVSSTTSTELGYVHGVTSAIQTQLGNKQDTLVSGTNIKTINGNSVLGSGDLTVDGGSSRNIGEIVASTIPLTDAGLHLLDGGIIQRGSYTDFVDYIAGLVSTYPDLFTTEVNWQQSVTDYGVCGKFVYNSTNKTVRLPKITGFTEGTITPTTVGNLTEAGLPNITGQFSTNISGNTGILNGSFYTDSSISGGSYYNTAQIPIINIDASRSSTIYGNSNTVQPQTIKVLYYICIATSTKTDIEVDIDEIATDLNTKVDKSDLVEIHCVVETYCNGTEWYRIWSDGWCEQGGESQNKTYTTINLLKPFKDTNYYLNASTLTTSYTSNASGNAYARIISASQVGICGYNDANWTLPRWEAKGYIS